MGDDRVPVLWITGPSGAGKSTVSWQLFSEAAEAGAHVAFADADQFCMCYPAPAGDPARERIKAQNIGALVPRYQAAGAQCVIVNGCLDPGRGLLREFMLQADVTLCRLRADHDEIRRRLTGRNGTVAGPEDAVQAALDEADALEAADFAGVCVDTTGVAPAGVAELVRRACRDWPGFRAVADCNYSDDPRGDSTPMASTTLNTGSGPGTAHHGGKVLLICGPTGVGKSTIGFQLYLRCVSDGHTAGYVDLDQIGFLRPGSGGDPGNHRLKAGNLAAMWQTYRSAGATHLVATGPIDSQAALLPYLRAFPAGVTVFRLHASPAELTRRIMSRGRGGSWPQPGDPLRGQPAGYLRQVAGEAIAQAEALDRAGPAAIRADVSDLTASEAADLIAALTTWCVG